MPAIGFMPTSPQHCWRYYGRFCEKIANLHLCWLYLLFLGAILSMDCSGIPPGGYLLWVGADEGHQVVKVVIRK